MHLQFKSFCRFSLLPVFLFLISGCATIGTLTIPDDTLKAKYTDNESKFITIEGMKIHYKDEGEGPAVVMIHGVCASLHTWDGWAEELKKHYRVIRLDLPGFGFSELNDPNVYNRDSALKMMEALDQAFGIEKISLVGNSLGGYVAWLYTSTHPEKVDKLILIDPVGQPMKMPFLLRFASNPLIRPFSRHIMPRFIFDTAVKQVYGNRDLITDAVKDRYFELAMRPNGKRDYVNIFTCLGKEAKNPHFDDGIADITRPTLIMWGTKDIWIDYNTFFPMWKATLPQATFISYEGLGHVPMEEAPEKTVKDAIDFLSGSDESRVAVKK